MDQGRQGRDQVDTAVVQDVRGQRRAAPASCARLQSWQLSPHACNTTPFGINKNGLVVGGRFDKFGDHGFLGIPGPNPPPPAATTADMILRGSNTSPAVAGQYEIYDIGNNSVLAGYSLGQVGTEFQFFGLGNFNGSETTDILLRNSNTAAFEAYHTSKNNITAAASFGAVG